MDTYERLKNIFDIILKSLDKEDEYVDFVDPFYKDYVQLFVRNVMFQNIPYLQHLDYDHL